jgi:hypothetical protein
MNMNLVDALDNHLCADTLCGDQCFPLHFQTQKQIQILNFKRTPESERRSGTGATAGKAKTQNQ